MANLVLSEKLAIVSCELSLLVVEAGREERVVSLAENEAGKSVSCLCVSGCGTLLAVCDERKQVCVLSLPDFRNNSDLSLYIITKQNTCFGPETQT